jgi:hypothetical protein
LSNSNVNSDSNSNSSSSNGNSYDKSSSNSNDNSSNKSNNKSNGNSNNKSNGNGNSDRSTLPKRNVVAAVASVPQWTAPFFSIDPFLGLLSTRETRGVGDFSVPSPPVLCHCGERKVDKGKEI